ncbi:MAG TPA: HAMP domain-containing methyl-accepting chemotaxis protein [Myxococcaceae bacterium]|nr:HAMP domain-containing methyl-accepting chemotaxis protein [Myxococcaceae bacterium]
MASLNLRRPRLSTTLFGSFALLLCLLLGSLFVFLNAHVSGYLEERAAERVMGKAHEVVSALLASRDENTTVGDALLARVLVPEQPEFAFVAVLSPEREGQLLASALNLQGDAGEEERFRDAALAQAAARGYPPELQLPGGRLVAIRYNPDEVPYRIMVGLETWREQALLKNIRTAMAAVLIIGPAIFLIFLAWIGRRFVLAPLEDMQAMARRLSESDLTGRVAENASHEMGSLAEALNRIGQGLRDTLGRIRGVGEGVADVIEQLSRTGTTVSNGASTIQSGVEETSSSMAEMITSLRGIADNVEVLYQAAEESSASIMEMAATNEEVSENVQAMAGSVEETTSAIEQMTFSIKEVAQSIEELLTTAEDTSISMREMDASIGQVDTNANETARLSEQVQADAEKGVEALRKTLDGIDRIKESSRTAARVFEALGHRIEEIGDVINVIDEVAEQTNLLALNAAIIAAQAGEHGKGFAVVAEEIKDLAERTGSSTQEIAALISNATSASREAVGAINQGVRDVEEGVQLGNEAEQALRKIYDSAQKSTQMVKAIARATVEQSRGSKRVTAAISRFAETMQQISAASNEQAKGSEQIMKSAERMKALTQHVQRSAQEQSHGSRQITRSIEKVNEMVTHLNRAQKEQTLGSEQVMKAVERIKVVGEQQLRGVRQLEQALETLQQQAEVLRAEVRRFRV